MMPRRFWASRLSALTLVALLFSVGAAQTPNTQRVVFVCEHGSVKSLIAASYFNWNATKRGLKVEAVARGTHPEPSVPTVVQHGLKSDGMDVSGFVPQPLRASDLDGATLVVSFDQDIDAVVGGRVPHWKWDNLPAVLANYPLGRDAIFQKVDALIDELGQAAVR